MREALRPATRQAASARGRPTPPRPVCGAGRAAPCGGCVRCPAVAASRIRVSGARPVAADPRRSARAARRWRTAGGLCARNAASRSRVSAGRLVAVGPRWSTAPLAPLCRWRMREALRRRAARRFRARSAHPGAAGRAGPPGRSRRASRRMPERAAPGYAASRFRVSAGRPVAVGPAPVPPVRPSQPQGGRGRAIRCRVASRFRASTARLIGCRSAPVCGAGRAASRGGCGRRSGAAYQVAPCKGGRSAAARPRRSAGSAVPGVADTGAALRGRATGSLPCKGRRRVATVRPRRPEASRRAPPAPGLRRRS